LAWAFGWAPARAAAGDEWMAPLLAQLLDDPYAAVRFIAGRALASLPGQAQLEYDFLAPERARRAARDAAIDRWRAQPGAPKERVFQDERGALDVAGLHALTRARDDRPVDLRE
ncbi:MAG: hypothetical protein KC636_24515, partial [Myxococcales bacterium]|nr:hypothetical protein [Myxococcales bacterium]